MFKFTSIASLLNRLGVGLETDPFLQIFCYEKTPRDFFLPGRTAAWYYCSCMPGTLRSVVYGGGFRIRWVFGKRTEVGAPFCCINVGVSMGFLKWWVSPTTIGFPTKNNQHLGCFGGYHHLRKCPNVGD